MSIVFRCGCGKKLQVKDETAGKACVCPGCGEKVRIPTRSTEDITKTPAKVSAATRAAPARARPKPPVDDEDRDDEDRDDDRPARRSAKKGGRRKKPAPVLWPWMAGGAVLLLAVVGVTLWLVLRTSKEADKPVVKKEDKEDDNLRKPVIPNKPPERQLFEKDVDLVNPDGMGFVAFQLGDWWDSPAGKKLREKAGTTEQEKLMAEQMFGVPQEAVQRVLIVVNAQQPCFVVTTKKPERRDAVLARVLPGAQQIQVRGRTIYVSPGVPNAVHFATDRVHVIGPQVGLQILLDGAHPGKTGALSAALAETTKHHVVVGVNTQDPTFNNLRVMMGDAAKGFAALFAARSAVLTLDHDGSLKGRLALTMPDAAQATAAKPQAVAALALLRVGLGQAKAQLPPEAKGALDALDALLGSAQVEQRDAVVEATFRVEEKVVDELIAAAKNAPAGNAEVLAMNNMTQLGLALHNYHQTHNALPAASISNAQGKPLLSWRVAILPYIEQDELYRQFKLDEPWDSPNNIKLLDKMPKIFASPGGKDAPNATRYRVFTGDKALFPPVSSKPGPISIGRKFTDITDGTSNTFAVVEAGDAVPWTKPEELVYDPAKPLPKLGTGMDGFLAVFADGNVRHISAKNDEKTIRAAITHAGNEPVQFKD